MIRGNAYALDATNGELLWKTLVDSQPLARITGNPRLYQGRLYVPVASLEEDESRSPLHVCCTFLQRRRGAGCDHRKTALENVHHSPKS